MAQHEQRGLCSEGRAERLTPPTLCGFVGLQLPLNICVGLRLH